MAMSPPPKASTTVSRPLNWPPSTWRSTAGAQNSSSIASATPQNTCPPAMGSSQRLVRTARRNIQPMFWNML